MPDWEPSTAAADPIDCNDHTWVRAPIVGPYDCVIRSHSQESTPLSPVLAIAVGWPVKPWGDSG